MRILLLGGTAEARELANELVSVGIDALFSYAGRTTTPIAQRLPTRVGGFGGVAGLLSCFQEENITHVVDATHPFAAQISRNLQAATVQAELPLVTLQRAQWVPNAQDNWLEVESLEDAARALPDAASRVFLAIGRQTIDTFADLTQHQYLLRFVDPPSLSVPLQNANVVVSRGPYRLADDLTLLRRHRIQIIVAKNSGGVGGEAKLLAARELGLQVIMVARPPTPQGIVLSTLQAVIKHFGHAPLGV